MSEEENNDSQGGDIPLDTGGDFLGMSDEAFMEKGGADAFDVEEAPAEANAEETNEDESTETESEPKAEDSDEDDEGSVDSEGDEAQDDEEDSVDEEDPFEGEGETAEDDADEEDEEEEGEQDEVPSDAEAFYKKLTTPFKANGKMMAVTNADDALQLMQMGANYNRKMHDLKPGLKALRTLQKNDLMGEEDLNFLIDIHKREPAAIAKLMQDAKIDPDEFDVEQGKDYKAGDHSASEREIALEDVVDRIKDSEHYSETLEIVGKQWDDTSRKAVSEAPELLETINEHVSNGIYKLISEQMDYQRSVGKLGGMSDIQAYKFVGDAIQDKGGFDHLFETDEGKSVESKGTETPRKKATRSKGDDNRRKEKRRAVGSTKKTPKKAPAKEINALGMSDEEFEKSFNPSLM